MLKSDQTITGSFYREQIICLTRALHEKQPEYEMRQHKVILLHDNARPHVTKLVKETLEAFRWKVLPHVAYLSDVPLHFSRWHTHLRNASYDIEKWVSNEIVSKDESFFRRRIRLLLER